MQVSFLGHTKDDAEEKTIKNKIETTTELTEVITIAEPPSQFHTTRDSVRNFKNIGKKFGIQVHFKSGRTIKEELVAPKDKNHITKKSGVIYRFKCERLGCDEEYIGETSRTFGKRYREHLKAPSPINDHNNISGHSTSLENFSIVGREENNLSRLIKRIYVHKS